MIAGLAIPILVIFITVIMVSVSFAWFSQDNTSTVQSITLNVQKSFMLSFTSAMDSTTRNIKYKGQTAIDSNGRLRTEYNGQTYGGFGSSASRLQQYMLDSPYYFITTIVLDTEDADIDMSMALDTAKIESKSGGVLNSYDSGAGGFAASDIPYAFTWYFKPHNAQNPDVNFIGDSVTDENSVMNYRLPSDGEVWYTPYGKLTFDENHLIKNVGEEEVDASYSILGGGYKDILLHAENTGFDFYIVFAPEKLFWAQFCVADRDKTVTDLYSAEELKKIFGEASNNQMYFSNMAYFGATFEFGATIKVSEIYKNEDSQTQ